MSLSGPPMSVLPGITSLVWVTGRAASLSLGTRGLCPSCSSPHLLPRDADPCPDNVT